MIALLEAAWLADLTQGYAPTVALDTESYDEPVWVVEYQSGSRPGVYQAEMIDDVWYLTYRQWDRTHGLSHDDQVGEFPTTELLAAEVIKILMQEYKDQRELDAMYANMEVEPWV